MPKILIADDEAYISTQLEERLTDMGYEVVGRASSGESCIEMAKNLHPDLVLMDILMPGKLDGISAAEIIKEDQDIPVVFLSGHSEDALIERAKHVEPYGYILKPFQEKEIKASIEVALYKKRMDRLLCQSEKKYRELVSNIPGIVFTGHKDWSIDFIDNKIEALTGYRREDFNSRKLKWNDIIFKDDIEQVRKIFTKALKANKIYIREYRIRSKEGEKIWIQQRGRIICDNQGEILYVNGVLFDISDLKRIEEKKEKLEARLQQTQKMESIGTLASGIAHEFNNLMTTIIGNAHMLLMSAGKDDFLIEGLEDIKYAGERAARLTRKILAFSRKQMIHPKVLDLNEVLTDIASMLVPLIEEHIELKTIYEPALRSVKMDPAQIDQVVMNLVNNARDAMPKGGTLTIETANVELGKDFFDDHGIEEQPGYYVMFSVTDTGTGMDERTQEHMFEPFYTTKEIEKGAGLGLSSVYGIVKQNDGFIQVHSEPGQGSTFKIYLPIAENDSGAEIKDVTREDTPKGSGCILLVEDDYLLRKLTRKVLKKNGYRVLEAENGEKALKMAAGHDGPIHLLITDVVMPEMSGREVADSLQSLRPEVKVLYMSGYTDSITSHHGVLEKEVNFIEKPFTPECLALKVREVMDKKQD